MGRFLAILLLLAAPALAQNEEGRFPYLTSLVTRYGAFSVQGRYPDQLVYFQGRPLPALQDAVVHLRGAFALAGEEQDWVVVSLGHGGNMCPLRFALIQVRPEGVRMTAPFAECGGAIRDLKLTPGKVELDVVTGDVAVDYERYVFDGERLTVAAVGKSEAGAAAAGAGAGVTRWAGGQVYDYFNDAGERLRLQRIMSRDEVFELQQVTSVPDGIFVEGDFLYGAGCQQHACNVARGAWAVRISDGQPFAVIRADTVRVFGGAVDALPFRLQRFVAGGSL